MSSINKNWIDEFARGSFSLYSGNTISSFQPLDFFHFYPMWYDLWVPRIAAAITTLGWSDKPYKEIGVFLPTPSNMRAILQKLIPSTLGHRTINKEETALVANFFARMLMEACPGDPFGFESNPLHREEEIKGIVTSTPWQEGAPATARNIGKLITAAGSLVHGLYNDVVTDFGWDTYGPYKNTEKDGALYTMLIRNFPDLRPNLWPSEFLPSVKEVKIYQLYQDVEWVIGCVGCHTIVKSGDPISGLKYFAVVADGKVLTSEEIGVLTQELAEKAEKIYLEIRRKNFEELKEMVMLQECYQLHQMFEAAEMNWRPTEEMKALIKDKPLLENILPTGEMLTDVKKYKEVFGLNRFAREILDEK